MVFCWVFLQANVLGGYLFTPVWIQTFFFPHALSSSPPAVITVPPFFASASPARDHCVFNRAECWRPPTWWMRLSVAQVRRHPWWDGLTVHHSVASSALLPFCTSFRSPLCCHTWQMANARNTFPNILPFFPLSEDWSVTVSKVITFLPLLCYPQHPSLIEPWQLMNLPLFKSKLYPDKLETFSELGTITTSVSAWLRYLSNNFTSYF